MLIGDGIQKCAYAGVVVFETEIGCCQNIRLLAPCLEEARKNFYQVASLLGRSGDQNLIFEKSKQMGSEGPGLNEIAAKLFDLGRRNIEETDIFIEMRLDHRPDRAVADL